MGHWARYPLFTVYGLLTTAVGVIAFTPLKETVTDKVKDTISDDLRSNIKGSIEDKIDDVKASDIVESILKVKAAAKGIDALKDVREKIDNIISA